MTANIKTLVDAFVTQVNDQDYNIAEDINGLQEALDAIAYANIGQASFANGETLSGTKTLTDDSPALQFLNPNAADKDVFLAAVAATNHSTVIMNTNGGNYVLNVKNAGGTVIRVVPPGKAFIFVSDGTQWVVVGFDLYKTISPAQITASQNNYNPTGAYEADIMRLDSDAAYNITGLAGGSAGRMKIIRNIGTHTLTFKNEDASSTAANRFDFGADFALETKKTMLLIYDPTSARWGMIGGGGAAASTPYDFLSTLSNTEISVTTTATLTIGRMHVCSGTSADYTVSLPAASGNAGNFVGVRGATGLTKKVTIDGNASELVNGVASMDIQAGYSVILMCDGTNWFTVSQRSQIGAWLTLNGTGTIAILASQNVSSVTDNSTGRYTVNFITAFPDANYCAHVGGANSASNKSIASNTTTSCQINFYETGVGYVDVNPATALFVR